MGKVKDFSIKFGAIFLSASVLATSILPNINVYAAEAGGSSVDEKDYAATQEQDRKIVTGQDNAKKNWSIVWSDEFNEGSLDTSKWSYMIGTGANYSGDGWGNNEQEYYTDGDNASFVTEDGADCLKITARKEEKGGKSFTSTRLWTMDDSANPGKEKTTKFAKTYGRFESRIKINNQEDNMAGIWPAFWLMPANDEYGTWASSGELDIMEARGSNKNSVDGTIHYGSQWPNNKSIGGSLNKSTAIAGSELPDFSYGDWHTYAVEWLPGEICWYVDDTLYYKTSNWYATSANNGTEFTYPAPFDQDFYILLNLAVGGNYDGGALDSKLTEASMLVDYVRVYDLTDEAGNLIGYDESNVQKPQKEADDKLVSGTENETNYVDSSLADTKKTTGYPNEADRTDWFVSELEGGKANASYTDENGLTVDVIAGGNQSYSVQLIHNVPLTKGYRYVMEFDAKADDAKTLSAKFGNIGGYPAYSDSYDVDLTTDWQHYKYVFDMTSTTDADGRIEFNFQQSTGKCYFKNFSIISTGKTPDVDEDASKEPLANGNHIYNGTFDQGTGRMGFWHVVDADASVSKAERKLNIAGKSENACVYQKGMNLLKKDSYKLTFDAKATEETTIQVLVENSDATRKYAEKVVNVGENEQKKEVTFTMPDISDAEAVVKFVIGTKTITMDNVSMIRTTNNNIDWDSVDLYPMTNGLFFNGEDGWNIWTEGDGGLSRQVVDGNLSGEVNIPTEGNFWRVGMQSAKVKCKSGIPYKISVKMNLDVDKTIKIETPDGDQKDYQFNKGDNEKIIEFTPSKDCNGKITLYWGVETGVVHFNIDYIDIVVDDSKLTIPEGNARPAEIRSAGPVTAGDAFTIETNNATWVDAVTCAYVNDVKVELDKISKNGTEIQIDGSVVPDEGSYSVKFDADGYVSPKSITQKVLPASGNVLVNGSFDNDLDGWTTWHHDGGTGSTTWQDGVAVNTITSSQGAVWDNQLKQANMSIEAADYYLVSFDAYADIERPIQMEFNNLGTASATVVNLTTQKQRYYITLTNVPASTVNHLLFMMGDGNGYSFSKEHNIYIDNVVLKKATAQEVADVVAPTIQQTSSAMVGKKLTFGYSDNKTWASKNLSVTMDGNPVADSYVTKDTSKNEIAIAADVITESGNHVFEFSAEGYSVIKVSVNVLAAGNNNLLSGLEWSVDTYDGDKGNIAYEDNILKVDFVETVKSQWDGPEFWSMQAKSGTFTTLADTEYELSFDYDLTWNDGSNGSRTMKIEYLKDGAKNQPDVTLQSGRHSYSCVFTPGANAANYILFMPGGNELGVLAHTLNISNIKLRIYDGETEELVINAEEPVKPSEPSKDDTKPADTITGVKNNYTVKSDSKNFTLEPEGYGDITFASSNSKVAKVDPKTGKVTVKGPGIVKITISASGDDTHAAATKVITIKVSPEKAAVKSATSKKAEKLTVTWKRDTKVSGYEIQYSTNKNFKNVKTVKVGKNATTSKTINKLKSGKKYYVRVRSYKNSGNTKLNGSWSATKSAVAK